MKTCVKIVIKKLYNIYQYHEEAVCTDNDKTLMLPFLTHLKGYSYNNKSIIFVLLVVAQHKQRKLDHKKMIFLNAIMRKQRNNTAADLCKSNKILLTKTTTQQKEKNDFRNRSNGK